MKTVTAERPAGTRADPRHAGRPIWDYRSSACGTRRSCQRQWSARRRRSLPFVRADDVVQFRSASFSTHCIIVRRQLCLTFSLVFNDIRHSVYPCSVCGRLPDLRVAGWSPFCIFTAASASVSSVPKNIASHCSFAHSPNFRGQHCFIRFAPGGRPYLPRCYSHAPEPESFETVQVAALFCRREG